MEHHLEQNHTMLDRASKKIENEVQEVLKNQPGLIYYDKSKILSGTLLLIHNGKTLDNYKVEIKLNPYPLAFPICKEIGERIPRNENRHIYSDGSCCFTTKAKEQILLVKYIKTIPNFIDEIVIKFFLNNSYYEIEGKYKEGAYSHGLEGILEAYADILNIFEPGMIIEILKYRLEKRKFQRNRDFCFCGSKTKIKNCHLSNYEDLFFVNESIIRQDLENLSQRIR